MIGKPKGSHNCLKRFPMGTKADSITSLSKDETHAINTVKFWKEDPLGISLGDLLAGWPCGL